MTHNSVFFSNALPLLRSSLIQISHCCIRERFKAMLDTAGQANGSKPESLQSVGVFFFFHPFIFFLSAKKKNGTKCILSSQACRRGRRYLSQQPECWKGTISKGQRIKSHESILLCAFCCCLFESICFADIFPMWLAMLFPLIASAIDVLRLLYSEVHHRQRDVTLPLLSATRACFTFISQPCTMGTRSLQGLSWQTENKLLLTKGTALFLSRESAGIPCDTNSPGMNPLRSGRSAGDTGHQAVVGRWSLERSSVRF